jgi:hypothetical protein
MGVAEFTKGLGEVAEEGSAAAKGVATPPGTGGAAAGLIPAAVASLQQTQFTFHITYDNIYTRTAYNQALLSVM